MLLRKICGMYCLVDFLFLCTVLFFVEISWIMLYLLYDIIMGVNNAKSYYLESFGDFIV